ncbi:MAG: hypothetical protein ABIV36_07120, partial [Sphingobium limneticum]
RATVGKELLCETVGLFLVSFGSAEHQISRILAHVLGFKSADKNFEQFDFLARDMDIRAKIAKLEDAAKIHAPMGPNIAARIKKFNGPCRKARNNLAHSETSIRSGSIWCSSIGAHAAGSDPNVRPSGIEAPRYPLNYIQELSLWLVDFRADLAECAERTWRGESFEIDHPRSTE